MRYRRQAFYDKDLKAWKTYYINKDGKIIYDSGKKSYNEARQILKKNIVKRKDDLISKKMSLAIAPSIKTRKRWQTEADKLLKKKRLSEQEREKLQDLAERAGYKKTQVKKKVKQYKAKPKKEKLVNYIQMNILCTFHSTTSTQFYIAENSFKNLKKAMQGILKKSDRINVEFEGMEGSILKSSFKSAQAFNDSLSKVIGGYGAIPFSRGKFKIKIKGVKR